MGTSSMRGAGLHVLPRHVLAKAEGMGSSGSYRGEILNQVLKDE